MSGSESAGYAVDAAPVASVTAADDMGGGGFAPDGHTHESACLNCGIPLNGPFCHECGQAAHAHRTLAAFFHDLLHGVFHFEQSIWHTLPLLALKPGALTRRYINGQRARFISPLALFLFCVFLLFAAIQQTAKSDRSANIHPKARDAVGTMHNQLQSAMARLTKLDRQRSDEIAHHQDTRDTDAAIANLQTAVVTLKHSEDSPAATTPAPDTITGLPTGSAFINRMIASIEENPGLALYKVEMHAYKYSWLLIPISVPFVWLLFPFDRRFPVYDHAVFVTYSISFMTLLTIVVLILNSLGLGEAGWLIVVVPPIHMYRQLRGAYQCSRPGAALRTLGLLVAAALALMIFVGVIVAQSTD